MAISQRQPISLERLVNPTDKQREFLQAIADKCFTLYGGAAGGGKSYILRWWLVLFLVWCFRALGLRNVRVGLFCEDYPALRDRHLAKIRFEFPQWLGTMRESVREFELRAEYGGGVIAFRNLDDTAKYQSAEFAAIAVDELTKNSKEVFDFLRFRLRWPGVDRPRFAAATNPGGIGHAWVKKLWIERNFPPELEAIKDEFAFVQARAADNPYLTPDYYRSLLTLPPDMARKFADGDWDVYTGQYFPQFDPKRHVIRKADAEKRIKSWWTKTLSGDWGYEHPSCFHWHAKNERGQIITYRELWGRRVGEAEWGQRITAASAGERLVSFPFSWDAGKLSPRSPAKYPKSIVQLLSDSLGPGVPKPHPADSSPGSRMSGFRLMSQLLEAEVEGEPMWMISDACPKLIQCLPSLVRDENDLETLLKVDFTDNEIGDDPADSARMGLQNEFGASVLPATLVAEKRVAEFAQLQGKDIDELDINTTAQLHRRALNQENIRRRKRRGGLGRIWRPQTGQ